MRAEIADVAERLWMVVVYRPSAVADVVIEMAASHYVVLIQDVVADETRALALAWNRANPVEFVIAAASVWMVLHVLPHAIRDFLEFELYFIGVGNCVDVAAVLNPPEVVVFRPWAYR